mmetsp:Transcript_112978/g.269296  ORF Transcript_112978/g.269296 Transcript_112978/m.269296 type:complete len:233 (+) Transcript_112978:955-1653(+)
MQLARGLPQVLHRPGHHEFHRCTRHGHRAFADLRSGAHHLAHSDRCIEHPRDDLSAAPSHRVLFGLLDGMLVASLDLREDLGFSEDEGVQTRADLKQVLRRGLAAVAEKIRLQLLAGNSRLLAQESPDGLNGCELLDLRGGEVELEAVACGKDGQFRHQVAVCGLAILHQLLRIGVPIGLGYGQLFPHLHRCAVMAEPNDVDLHHCVDTIIGTESGQRFHRILLHFADPVLG